jgi:hypothetical protein
LSGISNFVRQLPEYLSDTTDEHKGRLAVLNLLNAARGLASVADGFEQLFRVAPNYFDVRAERLIEQRRNYEYLGQLISVWAFDRPAFPVPDISTYMTYRAAEIENTRMAQIARWASDSAIEITLPSSTFEQGDGSRGLVLGFSVETPFLVQLGVEQLLISLPTIKETVTWFYLIPLFHGKRFVDGAYRLSSFQLSGVEEGRSPGWELLVPLPLPEQAASTFALGAQMAIPEFMLMAKLVVLYGETEVLARWQRECDVLPDPGGRFDQLVRQRYGAELESAAQALLCKVSELAASFGAEWPERRDLQPIVECLHLMESALGSLDFARLLDSELLLSTPFQSAVQRLTVLRK